MSFAGEMNDFLKAAQAMSDVRYRNAARRKIEWELEPNPYTQGETPSVLGGAGGGGGIGTTTAPGDKSASGRRKYNDAAVGNRGGGAFVQQVYDYYRAKGLPHAAAAGIAGNLMQESGGDPRVLGGHRSGDAGASKFAAQWQGPRLRNLYAFAGNQQPTLQQQLDFVLEEMDPNSPYVDMTAAQAYDSLIGAKTVEDATAIFRKHFERPSADDLAARTKFALTAADSGNYGATQVAGGVIDTGPEKQDSGAIPEEDEEEPVADSGGADIDVVAAPEAAPVEAPQVATNLNPLNVPPEEDPTLYAARGGAIPDDTAHYAAGGTSYLDKYAENRTNFAQPAKFATSYKTPSGSVPHRINIPARDDSWRTWGVGGSPTQKKHAAALAAARQPEPTTPVQKQPQQGPMPFAAMVRGAPQGGNSGGGPAYNRTSASLPQGAQWTDARSGKMTYNGQQYQLDANARQWVPVGVGKLNPVYHGGYTSYQWQPNVQQSQPVRMGMFAKGGRVSEGDPEFKEWERRYSRPGGGGAGGLSARDRAARTMNARRGVASYATEPGERRSPPPPRQQPERSASAPPAAGPDVPIPRPRPPNHQFPPDLAVSPPHERWPGATDGGGDVTAAEPPVRSPIVSINKGGGQDAEGNQIFITVPPLVDTLSEPTPALEPVDPGEAMRANPRYPNVYGFERGGAIPDDDEYDNTKWRRDKSRGTFFQTLAKPGKTTKGGGAPQTKSSKKVRRPDTDKPASRNAKKRSKDGKPRTVTSAAPPVPTPKPRPTDSTFPARPGGEPAGMPAARPASSFPVRPAGEPAGMPAARPAPGPFLARPEGEAAGLPAARPPGPFPARPEGEAAGMPPRPPATGGPGIPGYGALGSSDELVNQLDQVLRKFLPNDVAVDGYDIQIIPRGGARPEGEAAGMPAAPPATGGGGMVPGYGAAGGGGRRGGILPGFGLFVRGGAIPDDGV